jgi:hypothetical protein
VYGGDLSIDGYKKTQNITPQLIDVDHTHYKYAIFHDMVYFPDPVKDIRNPLNK